MECQEIRCIRKATKDWNGMMVCADHFETYVEEIDKVRREWSP